MKRWLRSVRCSLNRTNNEHWGIAEIDTAQPICYTREMKNLVLVLSVSLISITAANAAKGNYNCTSAEGNWTVKVKNGVLTYKDADNSLRALVQDTKKINGKVITLVTDFTTLTVTAGTCVATGETAVRYTHKATLVTQSGTSEGCCTIDQ